MPYISLIIKEMVGVKGDMRGENDDKTCVNSEIFRKMQVFRVNPLRNPNPPEGRGDWF